MNHSLLYEHFYRSIATLLVRHKQLLNTGNLNLGAILNIIITYLFQLGQCHNCKNNISIIYPLVELLVGLIWLFSAIYFQNLNNILIFSIISTVLVAISIIDLKHYIIPIELSIFSLIVITFNLLITNTFMNHLSGLIIGTGYLSIVFLFTWLLTKKQALGLGDIQLIFVLGYWIGDIRILLVF